MKLKNSIMKKLMLLTLVLATMLGAAGCGNAGSSTDTKTTALDKEMESYYVTADWLKDNLENVVIIDARADKEYNAAHIKGAINVTWQMLSDMTVKQGEANWGVILPQAELEAKLGSLGIDGSKTVIVYNDPSGLGEEGRLLWSLRTAGIENSKMLNGGYPAWTAAQGETSTEAVKPAAVSFKITSPQYDSLLATTEYVKSNKDNIKLVDTRSTEEYNGSTNHGENYNGTKAYGHIEGAVSLPYSNLYNDDGTIKSIADLKAVFEAAGLKPEDEIVTYCTVGIRSGFTAEILRMCGYTNAKNYNGSFSEWAGSGLPYVK
ncbi:MAG: SseA [Firmicutes bacterium]|nr:SseA [Bacillota bacterium]